MRTLMNILKNRLLETPLDDGAPGGGPAPTAPTTVTEQGSDLYSGLADLDENAAEPSSNEEPGTGVTAPPEPAPAAPAITPSAAPVVPPPAPAAPVPPSTETPPAPVVPPVETPPAAPATPPAAEQPIDFAKHRAEFLPKLQELYTLTEEEATELRADPVAALPKMAARLHYEVQHAVSGWMMTVLPQAFEKMTTHNRMIQEQETAFYTAFPALKGKPEYDRVVVESLKAVRAVTPTLTPQEAITRAGIMASIQLGIPLPGTAPAAPVTPPPAAPATGLPRPAGRGATGHVQVPVAPGGPTSDNLFEDLGDDFSQNGFG